MPDNDIIQSALVPCWQAAGRLLRGGHPLLEVASASDKALARSLRQGGGLPGLDRLTALLEEVQAGQLTPGQAMDRLHDVEYEYDGSRHIKVAAQATRQLVAEVHQGASFLDARRAVAERFCWELLDHQLFGRLRPLLIGTRFADRDEAAAFEAACKAELTTAITKLASQLLADPTATALRAPALRARTRRTTEELMALDLLSDGESPDDQ